jgi:hypothetical protein
MNWLASFVTKNTYHVGVATGRQPVIGDSCAIGAGLGLLLGREPSLRALGSR